MLTCNVCKSALNGDSYVHTKSSTYYCGRFCMQHELGARQVDELLKNKTIMKHTLSAVPRETERQMDFFRGDLS